MHPADLAQHECLGFPKVGKWTLHREGETVEVEVGGRFHVNSVGMFRRLATLDLGVVLLPEEVAAEDVMAGRLRQILPEWQSNPTSVYALTETRLLPAKISVRIGGSRPFNERSSRNHTLRIALTTASGR